jgi:class 3 adenylate cyclase
MLETPSRPPLILHIREEKRRTSPGFTLAVTRPGRATPPKRVTTRTQVIHVTGDQELQVAGGRMLADLIPGAKLVEVDGADHFSWIMPNWRDVADEVIKFAIGGEIKRTTSRQFATVMFTDVVDSTRQSAAVGDEVWRGVLDGHDRTARRLIDQHRGRIIKSTGDGLLVTFDAPSQTDGQPLPSARYSRHRGIFRPLLEPAVRLPPAGADPHTTRTP